MSISPLITFKAGMCSSETPQGAPSPIKVKPQAEPGYIYLYSEDELMHFCWRRRDQTLEEPELDLVIVPGDASFKPYDNASELSAKTNGRIFVFKFYSSSQRYHFWLQSKPQGSDGNPSYFSPRDRKIGDIVNNLLQGDEVDVTRELRGVNRQQQPPNDDDDDDEMEDVDEQQPLQRRTGSTGGAGPDATGGDVRDEGEESREGGSDGARAVSSSAPDAAAAVRNFLESLQGQKGSAGAPTRQGADLPYPHLTHLLPTSITVPMIHSASEQDLDVLLSLLPPAIVVFATDSSSGLDNTAEPSADAVEAAKASLSTAEKKALLQKVARSPQFHQALGVLSSALRDGGLPSIADALGVQVENGGYFQGGGMSMGGGQAVKAFVDGIKKSVQEKRQ